MVACGSVGVIYERLGMRRVMKGVKCNDEGKGGI